MTELTEVSRAHKSKPDRSEPWRYVCPQCGRQVDGWNAAQGEYECENGHQHTRSELHDKKTGERGVKA